MRVGLLAILVLALLATATACIFDQSDYQGGGRVDQGATAVTASAAPTDTTVPTDTTAPTDTTPPVVDDSGVPILDDADAADE
jgi:hypothetical protein